jgi:hypothetical protein
MDDAIYKCGNCHFLILNEEQRASPDAPFRFCECEQPVQSEFLFESLEELSRMEQNRIRDLRRKGIVVCKVRKREQMDKISGGGKLFPETGDDIQEKAPSGNEKDKEF